MARKAKKQYLLSLQESRYCLLPLQNAVAVPRAAYVNWLAGVGVSRAAYVDYPR